MTGVLARVNKEAGLSLALTLYDVDDTLSSFRSNKTCSDTTQSPESIFRQEFHFTKNSIKFVFIFCRNPIVNKYNFG